MNNDINFYNDDGTINESACEVSIYCNDCSHSCNCNLLKDTWSLPIEEYEALLQRITQGGLQ